MNHQKVYDSIVLNAKTKNRKKKNGVYYEKHHINPKCMSGNDDNTNLVLLTAKEHYICHKLLTYIYPGNRKIACAFYFMTCTKKIKSSRNYSYARELICLIPISEETRKKMSAASTGRTHICTQHSKNKLRSLYLGKTFEQIYGKEKAQQLKLNMSNANKGKLKTKEHKDKIRNAHYGIKPSIESLKNNSESNKNSKKYICEYCGILVHGGNYNRWHGKKCKKRNN